MIYVDPRGRVNCEVSTSLGLRTQDIFSTDFCQNFVRIVKQERGVESNLSPPSGT